MKISKQWLDDQWHKYKDKYKEDFSGFIIVDYAYTDGISEYYGFYFSPSSNAVLDNEGYFTPIEDYISEGFMDTDLIYALMKNVGLMDKEEIFNKDNWEILWDKKNNNTNIDNMSASAIGEFYNRMDDVQQEINKIKDDFDVFYINIIDTIKKIKNILDIEEKMWYNKYNSRTKILNEMIKDESNDRCY